jgi:hypothetical protein
MMSLADKTGKQFLHLLKVIVQLALPLITVLHLFPPADNKNKLSLIFSNLAAWYSHFAPGTSISDDSTSGAVRG